MARIFNLIVLILLSLSYSGIRAGEVVFTASDSYVDISDAISVLEDVNCNMATSDVFESPNFHHHGKLINLGVSSSCFWLKFTVKNEGQSSHLQLRLDHPILDQVIFYHSSDTKGLELGDEHPFNFRKYKNPDFIYDLDIPQGTSKDFYLRVRGNEQIVIPASIGNPVTMEGISSLKEMLFGIYAGIILVMFFYNIFLYFTVRDKSYLYYVIYIITVGLTQSALKGYTFKYIWPDSSWMAVHSVTILSCLAGIAAMEFVKEFLHTRYYTPRLHKVSYIVNGLFGVSLLLEIMGIHGAAFQLMQLVTMIGSLYALVLAIMVMRQGVRPAKFFLVAWSLLLFGAIIFVLKDFEILPINIFTNYALMGASVLEVILLSFALADKINILRNEKEQSQAEAFNALQENEKIIREQNIVLEAKVEERTSALIKANGELNVALEDLKNAQSQLVSAEKMASLGQLTAGIAHEINNPINFVSSSIKPLQQNIEEILSVLEKYDELKKNNDLPEILKQVDDLKDSIDYDYLLNETNEIIEGIEEGASRTAEIVAGLRTFSHVDDIGIKKFDLHKGIDSTIKLLKGEINGDVEIVRNYGDMPPIEAYGGKINQVFMNILSNALHAIAKKETGEGGVITISTADLKGEVEISITDNGIGMDEEVKSKIFEPFFTTKDVGAGTGLGLSVVYGIMESHHGRINVTSEIGKGSTFIITLPYSQP